MNLTPTHAHLLLNHLPTIGFGFGLGLFVCALVSRSDDLKRAGLVLIAGVALMTIPTYITGNAARDALTDNPSSDTDPPTALVDAHEAAALVSLVFMETAGLAAWVALWQFRRTSRIPGATQLALLLLSAVTLSLVVRTAGLGGEIGHPEIRAAADAATTGGAWVRVVRAQVVDRTWIWPAAETLHFVGLSLLMGVVALVNLRVLGVMKQLSVAALDRLLPLAILGFGVNLVTGMAFFVGVPQQYTANSAFYWKLGLLLVAGADALYFTAFDRIWQLVPGQDARTTSKLVALSAMCLWVGVMYFGRMLPFIGDAF